MPAVDRIRTQAYEVDLDNVLPGETRIVLVEVEAAAYWRHEGFIEAEASDRIIRVEVRSFVFP
jgi:hypothetical protein